jgi:DtxR family Mn-dependent transcriptional regulator
VRYEPYRPITLTPRGRRLAEEVARRHRILKEFLVEVLGLNEDEAEENACRMEHAVDRRLLDHLRRFAEYLQAAPVRRKDWMRRFRGRPAERFAAEDGRDA